MKKLTKKEIIISIIAVLVIGTITLFGSSKFGGQRPSDFSTTLSENLAATASTTENISVASMVTTDGRTLTSGDVGDFICFHINPGASNDELVCCSGGISGTEFLDCSRGYGFYTNGVVSGNENAHSIGETVTISNDDAWLVQQYAANDDDETISGDWTFKKSTSTKARLWLGGDGGYLYYDPTTGNMGFASTTGGTEFAFGVTGAGLTFQLPLSVSGGLVKLATSTLSGLRMDNDGYLQIATSSGTGIYIDTDNTFKVATTTNFAWTGTHSFAETITANATTTFNANTIGCNGQYYLTASTTITGSTLPQPVYFATSTSAIQLSDANSEFAKDFMGFAISSATNGESVLIQTSGIVDGFTGLDNGLEYFVQDAVGTIGSATGTAEIYVGRAISATEVLIDTSRSEQYLGVSEDFAATTDETASIPAYTNTILLKYHITKSTQSGGVATLKKYGINSVYMVACGLGTAVCLSQDGVTMTWDKSANTLKSVKTEDPGGTLTAYFYR